MVSKYGSTAHDVKYILSQIQRKYTHKQCYSHVIPFLPVVHSLEGLAIFLQHRERGGGPFRDRRCYRCFIIARRPRTRGNWISVRREKFSFLPGGVPRWLPSLSSAAHSIAWNALSSPRADDRISVHVRKNPFSPYDCLHFAHGNWDQSSITM